MICHFIALARKLGLNLLMYVDPKWFATTPAQSRELVDILVLCYAMKASVPNAKA